MGSLTDYEHMFYNNETDPLWDSICDSCKQVRI